MLSLPSQMTLYLPGGRVGPRTVKRISFLSVCFAPYRPGTSASGRAAIETGLLPPTRPRARASARHGLRRLRPRRPHRASGSVLPASAPAPFVPDRRVVDFEVDQQLELLVPGSGGRGFLSAFFASFLWANPPAGLALALGSSAVPSATGCGLSRSGQPLLLLIFPLAMTIRHSVSGSDSISRRLCSGSSTQQAFARASASIALRATTVALATRSTGSPVRGSKTCEYHLPPIRKPRWELPLVATERSLILMKIRGSLDSESAQGATIPIGAGEVAADSQVAADVQKNALTSLLCQRRFACPAHDITLGDSVQADRAIRKTLGRASGRVELPGRRGHQGPVLGQLIHSREPVQAGAAKTRAASGPRLAGRKPRPLFRIHESQPGGLRIARARRFATPCGVLASGKARSRGRSH